MIKIEVNVPGVKVKVIATQSDQRVMVNVASPARPNTSRTKHERSTWSSSHWSNNYGSYYGTHSRY